ncbi:hypothetical protein ACFDTO_30590 [Microbacteriaceae bacterium 4G12]
MGVIPWGTMIYQFIFFVILIGVPFVLIRFFRNRTSKMKDLEQRMQQLEDKQQK